MKCKREKSVVVSLVGFTYPCAEAFMISCNFVNITQIYVSKVIQVDLKDVQPSRNRVIYDILFFQGMYRLSSGNFKICKPTFQLYCLVSPRYIRYRSLARICQTSTHLLKVKKNETVNYISDNRKKNV